MKKILYLSIPLMLIYLSGCSQGIVMQKSMIVSGYDFSKYSKIGFLFTPEKYNGSYESIGLVEVDVYPAVLDKAYYDDTQRKFDRWSVDKISTSEVIDSLYAVCNKMGANALTNFKIEVSNPASNGAITYYGIKASGFAIKR